MSEMGFKRRLLMGAAILPDIISEALMQAERSIIARLEANGAYVIREIPARFTPKAEQAPPESLE